MASVTGAFASRASPPGRERGGGERRSAAGVRGEAWARLAAAGPGVGRWGVTEGVVESGTERASGWRGPRVKMRGRLLDVAGNVVQNELQNVPPPMQHRSS